MLLFLAADSGGAVVEATSKYVKEGEAGCIFLINLVPGFFEGRVTPPGFDRVG